MYRAILAAAAYALLVLLFTWPVAAHFNSAIIGGGDAFQFLWNFWWLQKWQSFGSFWNCPALLHPYGVNLIQHDLALWPSLLGCLGQGFGLTPAAAYNIDVLFALWLNALSMYFLARKVVQDWWSAFLAGLVFAFAPYFWSRTLGHLSLMHAYPLVFYVFCLHQFDVTRSARWILGAGVAFTLAAYCSFYYAVYAIEYGILLALYQMFSVQYRFTKRQQPSIAWKLLLYTGIITGTAALVVALIGGTSLSLWGFDVKLKSASNLMIFCWISWLIAFLLRYEIRFSISRKPAVPVKNILLFFVPWMALIPLMIPAFDVFARGEFAAQDLGFKSGPRGAYVLTAAFPNIYHSFWRSWIDREFAGWKLMESGSIGLGIAAILIVIWKRQLRTPGWWRFAFVAFFLLNLGPFLRIFPGFEHGPVLPFWFLRFLPGFGWARIPSRAIAVALIAWSLLVAMGISKIKSKGSRAVVLIVILFESFCVPVPMSSARVPDIYNQIAVDPTNAAVLELPFGVKDGRKFWGTEFPPVLLHYQTVHGKPIVGGYLSRIPDRIFDDYKKEPVLYELVSLQDGLANSLDQKMFNDLCRRWNIRWIVLDTTRARKSLRSEMRRVLGKPIIKSDAILVWKIESADYGEEFLKGL